MSQKEPSPLTHCGEALANSPNVNQKTGTLPHGAPGSARPTGCMRIRLTACFGSVLLRGTPGSAFPTGRVRIRRTACFGFVLLRGTPGSAFPTGRVRIRRRWKQAVPVCCGAVGDAGPYTSRYSLFLLSASPSTIPTAVFFFSRLLPRPRHALLSFRPVRLSPSIYEAAIPKHFALVWPLFLPQLRPRLRSEPGLISGSQASLYRR